jgi:uncharacterized protein (DUF697 family)
MGENRMSADEQADTGSFLLKAVEAIAISPESANAIVSQYMTQAKKRNPKAPEHEIQKVVAKKIISRYSKLAATSGGVTALTGVIPGIGTAMAMTGGGMADTTVCLKLQVDMAMCLASTFGWDLGAEDARHLSLIIAIGGSLEKFGVEAGTSIATKAGVGMVRQYLKGGTLLVIKQMLARLGITFTRKALVEAIPFGVGVAINSSANYALTRYVGSTAVKWFLIDHEMRNQPAADEPDGGLEPGMATA